MENRLPYFLSLRIDLSNVPESWKAGITDPESSHQWGELAEDKV